MLLNSGRKLASFSAKGRKLAWTMRHGYGSEAQARMFFKLGAQAGILSSQGRPLACNMVTDQSAQARMCVNAGRKLACLSDRGASLHGPCSIVTDERRKLACS